MGKETDMLKEIQYIQNKTVPTKFEKEESSVCKLCTISNKNLTHLLSLCKLHNFNLAPLIDITGHAALHT
jgi:hypothetical protein